MTITRLAHSLPVPTVVVQRARDLAHARSGREHLRLAGVALHDRRVVEAALEAETDDGARDALRWALEWTADPPRRKPVRIEARPL